MAQPKAADRAGMSKRQSLWLVLAFMIAGILLMLSFRGIHWRVVADTIRFISMPYALLSVAIGLLPMLLRAARWRILLQAKSPVGLGTTFWAVAAGYFGNNFLPARGGELVRSHIIQSRSDLSLSYVLATALSERAADAVALILIGAVCLAFLPTVPAWIRTVQGSLAAIGLLATISLICLPMLASSLEGWLRPWPGVEGSVRQMLLGIASFHNVSRLARFVAFTIAIWAVDAVATSMLAFSLSINMPVAVAFLLIVALSLSSAIPSTPGYLGVYQFVAVEVLKPFDISPSAAIAFILLMQAISYASTSLLGLLAMYFTRFRWQTLRRPPHAIQTQN